MAASETFDFAEYLAAYNRQMRNEILNKDADESAAADEVNDCGILGAPAGWKPPGPPADWKEPPVRTAKGEPAFDAVDNPGGWSRYAFRPKFSMKKRKKKKYDDNGDREADTESDEEKDGERYGKYTHHELPTGAVPVPANEEGEQKVKDHTFHYQHRHTEVA